MLILTTSLFWQGSSITGRDVNDHATLLSFYIIQLLIDKVVFEGVIIKCKQLVLLYGRIKCVQYFINPDTSFPLQQLEKKVELLMNCKRLGDR